MNNKKILLSIVVFLILSLGIVAGILLVNQNQDIREKAAPSTSLSFIPSSLTKNPGQSVNLTIKADTGENKITGIDIEVTFDPEVIQFTQMAPSVSVSDLSTIIKNGIIDNVSGTARFAAFTVDKTKAISGNLNIITLTGTVLSGAESGPSEIKFSASTSVAAVDEGQNVVINSQNAIITVSDGAGGGSQASPTASPAPTGGVGGAQITLPSSAPTIAPTKTPSPVATLTPQNNNLEEDEEAEEESLPTDIPVTGVSTPFILSTFVGIGAILVSLFLVF